MIKAVVFDMDGVLIDTEKHYYEAWQEAARSFGYDFRSEHALMLRSCDANVAAKMMKGIFGEDFDYFAVREVRRGLVAERLKKYGLEKKPGLDEILDYLKQNGIKTAVATATPIELTLQHLTKIGVKDKFDKIVSAKQVANGKPAPDVYLYACEQIGENPSDCIAVEDEYADNMYERSELDYLVYNDPLKYVKLLLSGKLKEHLLENTDYTPLADLR